MVDLIAYLILGAMVALPIYTIVVIVRYIKTEAPSQNGLVWRDIYDDDE